MQTLTPIYLAQLIAEQHNSVSAAQAESYIRQQLTGVSSDFVWMFVDERDGPQQEEADLYDVGETLAQSPLIISGVHFHPPTTRPLQDEEALLGLVPKILFKECHFHTFEFLEKANTVRCHFEDCTFHILWHQPIFESPINGLVLYKNCTFNQGVELNGEVIATNYNALFCNCYISQLTLNDLNLKDTKVFANTLDGASTVRSLRLENCHIHTKFLLDNVSDIERIDILSSEFSEKFAMIACKVNQLKIVNTNFHGLVDFYQTRFESFQIQKSIFKDFSGFEDCVFGKEGTSGKKIELRYVTFYSFINFRQARFNQPLDLRNTNRDEQPNFLDCTFSNAARLGTDRETYRIIKQSFEAVGNRIEANAFFAHEMDAYRHELRERRRGKYFSMPNAEEFLLMLNALISRHGQSYGRPLLWLLGTAGLFALQQANWPHRWVALPASLADWLVPVGDLLNAWAKGLVFFQPLYAKFECQEALILLVAVALSTFTWHLLVAVRRHNRR